MHGATIVEVDGDGLVTSWRDYLDRKEPEEQLKAAARAQRGVVERYLDGIVAHDWDAVTACLRPDVERVGPFGDVYTPRDVYVRFLADLVPTLAGYRMDVSRVRYAGRVAIAELSETVELDGEPVLTPEALVFELDDEGLIRHIAIYVQHLPRG
jgi:ketosteroid isomerase-like protein